jgi:hypothetical protein
MKKIVMLIIVKMNIDIENLVVEKCSVTKSFICETT